MKLKPYPEYKDSGVEWLDDVPVEWCVKPLKFISDLRLSNIDKHTVEGEPPVLLCNYVDVYKNERIGSDIEFMSATASEEQIKRLTLSVGDVIITKDSEDPRDIGIPAYVAEICPDLVCGYHLALIRSNKDTSGEFLYYFLKSRYAAASFENEACGITRYAIGKYSIGNLDISVPLLEDQITIARFLDRETSKLDTLVAKQEHLIELLLEKRQAIISHAVTKGLNPDAKMKDSGVEWLGMVPEGWNRTQIKHIVKIPVTDGPHETPEFIDEGVPFVSAEAVSSGVVDFNKIRGYISREAHEKYSQKYVPKRNDIYMVKSGATTGITAIVETDEEFNIWSPLAVIRCNNEMNPKFVLNFLRSTNFQQSVTLNWSFGTQQNIGMGVIENLFVTVPPLSEQIEIAEYLDNEISQIDTLIEKAKHSIELAKEHRSALISAAVTGKIDVREAA